MKRRASIPSLLTTTLTVYAKETIPNQGIVAGKTTGPDVVSVSRQVLGIWRMALPRFLCAECNSRVNLRY
jgi:hypothetical protein